ncbi:MAG: PrsW family glutamic-type intramembrane protease [Candidatus Nomurabacteria bacterium]|nr:PrsW family glutamic-type intramembrane protease [Candidatus Nomurabacteria bacterium]
MDTLLSNLSTIPYAILVGVVPALLWLWFWMYQEDRDDPEPIILVIVAFILGAILVLVAMWMEKFSINFVKDNTMQIIVWAGIEEILKLIGVSLMIFGNNIIRRPIDYPMYFIATALGFAAFENVLYLIKPMSASNTVVGMLTGNLRFLGSTLLHAIASSMLGIALGLSFYLKQYRVFYLLIGIICAIILHSVFNFFIMKGNGGNFLSVFGFLWVVAIINILIFEKLKRMTIVQAVS